jgi:cellobiose-specific phosphotransferase system component IIC
MKNIFYKTITVFTALLAGVTAFAQGNAADAPPEMAGLMRSNGKIYVVVAVVVTILAGILLYVVRLDRKITALEKQKNK